MASLSSDTLKYKQDERGSAVHSRVIQCVAVHNDTNTITTEYQQQHVLRITEYENSSSKKIIKEQQGLLIEKCRFLETAGCAKTCLHACKIPTQRFFLEEMGLPVTLLPNMTDFRYCN